MTNRITEYVIYKYIYIIFSDKLVLVTKYILHNNLTYTNI